MHLPTVEASSHIICGYASVSCHGMLPKSCLTGHYSTLLGTTLPKRAERNLLILYGELVPTEGFEPPTQYVKQ